MFVYRTERHSQALWQSLESVVNPNCKYLLLSHDVEGLKAEWVSDILCDHREPVLIGQ